MMNADELYMTSALALAKEAMERGEIPVGAVIVKDGEIIARASNTREQRHSALGHAELSAVQQACVLLGDWRLRGCTLYVTLEPCPMCAGALINARIDRVVFGAHDPNAGCCGSVCNLFAMQFNHSPRICTGVLAQECSALLTEFFEKIRENNP